jgi:hypothetical protein
MNGLELEAIAKGLKRNVWNKEMRLRAAAVIIQVAKEGNPKIDEFAFMKKADCIPGLAA